MTDVILGMGEVGQTLFDLLVDRKFDCVGIDLDDSKCKKYSENEVIKNPEYLHVCLPGELTGFTDIVLDWIDKIKNIQVVIIHSTVKPGTTKIIQEKLTIPILFNGVRIFEFINPNTKKNTSSHNPFNGKTRNHKNNTRKIINTNFIFTGSWSA